MLPKPYSNLIRIIVRITLAALFIAAGTLHLVNPEVFEPVMPPFIPFPYPCIMISGVFELMGGLGLLVPFFPAVTWLTRWGLVLLLIAVFPVNIYMAFYPEVLHFSFKIPLWVLWARLPLQFGLIWAVLWCTAGTHPFDLSFRSKKT
jgi:uncharacterized membrane protein